MSQYADCERALKDFLGLGDYSTDLGIKLIDFWENIMISNGWDCDELEEVVLSIYRDSGNRNEVQQMALAWLHKEGRL